MSRSIRAGIVGAAGYTAGELIRILIHHPEVKVTYLQSESQAGKKVSAVHRDLVGETDLEFISDFDPGEAEVIFLCKGHGESRKYLEMTNVPPTTKIVDLSHDFRLKSKDNPFVYGLPELNRDQIKASGRIANPGCFATCIQLGLLPAAAHHLIASEINISGITGSTGAGQSLSPTTHFTWRNDNMSVYKAFTHQHLAEIGESLTQLDGPDHTMNFIPYRGDFTRGIIITSYFDADITQEEAIALYADFYDAHPFTHVTHENPDLKQVVNTNKGLVYLEKHGRKLMVITVIDNLLKGASGQAVQNMNLIFGLDERTGLNLKPVAF